ncbi:diguanylate cyclase [Hahella sp. SMD15-11]|uniref:Diguanylate cyclase n=1 Tax=Thermohahella caldifontis TaxID=3142973 RepID=A0AB39UVH0_9GAMM
MALWLAPDFLSVKENLPESAWVYYVSRNRFVIDVPWVNDTEYHYTDATLTQEFFTRGTPVRNPERRPFWTRAYVDEYGQGLMVTASAPVYFDGTFSGIVAIDMTLGTLSRLLQTRSLAEGVELMLVNREHQILASPGHTPAEAKQVRMFSSLVDDNGVIPLGNPDAIPVSGFMTHNGRLYARRPINGAPWSLIFQADIRQLDAQIWQRLTPRLTVLLLLMAVFWVLLHLMRSHRALASSEQRYTRMFHDSNAPQLLIDPEDGAILDSNPAARELLGQTALSGKLLPGAVLTNDQPDNPPDHLCFTVTGAHGETRYLDAFLTRLNTGGRPVVHAILQDITRRKQAEERAQYRAFHDMLTHLPNRAYFMETLGSLLAQHERRQEQLAVLFVDLDNFKHINDTLGHEIGDEVLRQAAERLKRNLREGDIIARLGGDEFTVILPGLTQETVAANVATKLIAHILPAFDVQGYDLHVGASIGIAIYPRDGTSATDLIKHADVAMYQAKNAGRNQYCFYEAGMSAAVRERIRLENDLRHAIAFNHLFVEYLPVVRLEDMTLIGCEALIRWNHPEHGEMDPAEFVQLAEDTGLSEPLAERVVEAVLADLKDWEAHRLPGDFRLYLNISRRQVLSSHPLAAITSMLPGEEELPRQLVLEVPEFVLRQHPRETQRLCEAAARAGIPVCVDNFGSGYTSLRFLNGFGVAELKLEAGFLDAALKDDNERLLLKAIVDAARNMQLHVIAKGLASPVHLRLARDLGFHAGQGYVLSAPVPASAVRGLLSAGLPFSAEWLSS